MLHIGYTYSLVKIITNDKQRARLIGWSAAVLVVLIGAGWQLATRAGARAALAPVDLALLRYLIPAILLVPVWWRVGLLPAGLARGRLALIVAGAGLPFGLLAIGGASLAPAAHMGALMPGASPLLITGLAWCWLGSRPSRWQVAGLGLLASGLVLVTLPSWSGASGPVWFGDLFLVGAATLWAFYTLALRGSGLNPWQSAALVSAWSALGVVPLWLLAFASGSSLLLTATIGQVLLQVIFQGVIAGVLGLAVWGLAVKNIGPIAASSTGALVPALVAVGGWLMLGETMNSQAATGILVVMAGVWLASRPGKAAGD